MECNGISISNFNFNSTNIHLWFKRIQFNNWIKIGMQIGEKSIENFTCKNKMVLRK
jgi:hypothetical protein